MWSTSERGAAFDPDQKEGRGPAVAASKQFTEQQKAEQRVKGWQAAIKAKKQG